MENKVKTEDPTEFEKEIIQRKEERQYLKELMGENSSELMKDTNLWNQKAQGISNRKVKINLLLASQLYYRISKPKKRSKKKHILYK